MRIILLLPLVPLLLLAQSAGTRSVNLAALRAPAGERLSSNDPQAPILPNGRLITPRGRHLKIAAHPFGLALSPDNRTLVASSSGTDPFAISIITNLPGELPQLAQII